MSTSATRAFSRRASALTNERQLTYRGFVGFGYRNINGTARAVSARLDLQYSNFVNFIENKVSLGYVEPYIFGAPNRGRVNVTRKQEFWRKEDVGGVQIRDANILELLIERDITRHFKLTYTALRFSNDKVFKVEDNSIVITQNIGKTGALMEYDLRNDSFNPSAGAYSFLNFEYADPGLGSSNDSVQLINFIKTNGGLTQLRAHSRLNKMGLGERGPRRLRRQRLDRNTRAESRRSKRSSSAADRRSAATTRPITARLSRTTISSESAATARSGSRSSRSKTTAGTTF